MAINLSLGEMSGLVGKGGESSSVINALQQEVQQLAEHVEKSEKETVEYIRDVVSQAAEANNNTYGFVTEKGWAIIGFNGGELRKQLNTLLEESFESASKTDLGRVQINGQKSYQAAKHLLKLFVTLHNLIPDERIAQVKQQLSTILKAHAAEHPEVVSDKHISLPTNDLAGLDKYLKEKREEINNIPDRNKRIEALLELRNFSKQKYNELTTYAFGLQWDWNYTHILDEVSDLTTLLIEEASDGFDDCSKPFVKKIEELQKRVEGKKDSEKKRYNEAIQYAQELIENLNKAKQAFSETGDLPAFKQTIDTLFEEFEGRPALDKSRSDPWVQTFIIEPLEALRTAINSLINLVTRKPQEASKLGFFTPRKTGTSRELDKLEERLKSLGSTGQNDVPSTGG